MILHLQGPDIDALDAARHQLDKTIAEWGADTTVVDAPLPDPERKTFDPDAIAQVATLVLALPPAMLAVLDIGDRIEKRRRARELRDLAEQLEGSGVTIEIEHEVQRVRLSTTDPDVVLDAAAADRHD